MSCDKWNHVTQKWHNQVTRWMSLSLCHIHYSDRHFVLIGQSFDQNYAPECHIQGLPKNSKKKISNLPEKSLSIKSNHWNPDILDISGALFRVQYTQIECERCQQYLGYNGCINQCVDKKWHSIQVNLCILMQIGYHE